MLFTSRKTYYDRLCIMGLIIRNSILLLANSFILYVLAVNKIFFVLGTPRIKSNSHDGFNR